MDTVKYAVKMIKQSHAMKAAKRHKKARQLVSHAVDILSGHGIAYRFYNKSGKKVKTFPNWPESFESWGDAFRFINDNLRKKIGDVSEARWDKIYGSYYILPYNVVTKDVLGEPI